MCANSCITVNQKLSIRSWRNERAMHGSESIQNAAPSIFTLGIGSITTDRNSVFSKNLRKVSCLFGVGHRVAAASVPLRSACSAQMVQQAATRQVGGTSPKMLRHRLQTHCI